MWNIASVSMIQNARKWSNIALQYCVHIASREKDVKIYIAKANLKVDNINVSSPNGL